MNFSEGENDSFALLVADHQGNGLVVGEDCLYLGIGLVEGDVLVERIEDLHEVLVITLLILLVLLLEGDHNEIIVLELPDDLLLPLHRVGLHFLSASVLVDVLGVAFETDEDVTRTAHLHQLHLTLQNPLLLPHVLEPEQT